MGVCFQYVFEINQIDNYCVGFVIEVLCFYWELLWLQVDVYGVESGDFGVECYQCIYCCCVVQQVFLCVMVKVIVCKDYYCKCDQVNSQLQVVVVVGYYYVIVDYFLDYDWYIDCQGNDGLLVKMFYGGDGGFLLVFVVFDVIFNCFCVVVGFFYCLY